MNNFAQFNLRKIVLSEYEEMKIKKIRTKILHDTFIAFMIKICDNDANIVATLYLIGVKYKGYK